MIGTGRKIEVPRAGAMVPAFQLLDTVSKGVLGGGHGVLVYHCRKNTCARTGKRRPRFRCRTGCGNFSSPIRKTFFSAPHRVDLAIAGGSDPDRERAAQLLGAADKLCSRPRAVYLGRWSARRCAGVRGHS
jgi:hypothetical protein